MDKLDIKRIKNLVEMALDEDIQSGDITTNALIPDNTKGEAYIVAKQDVVVAGSFLATLILDILDKDTKVNFLKVDGNVVKKGEKILEISGHLKTILVAERTILNFMQRLSGIATLTYECVIMASPYGSTILDTRKTTPVWRDLEKYAVRVGGGENHRIGLYDQFLIKDNHLKVQERFGSDHIKRSVEKARAYKPGVPVEVEVQTKEEAKAAVEAKADRILLDNMTAEQMKDIVTELGKDIETEASGNVTLTRVEQIAKTGVNYISIGALTHSARAADLSMKVDA